MKISQKVIDMKSDVFRTFFSFLIKILAGVLGFGLFVLVSQVLGAENFGVFSTFFSIAMMFSMLFSFGQQTLLVKECSSLCTEKKSELVNSYYLYSIISSFIFLFLGCFVLYLFDILFLHSMKGDFYLFLSVCSFILMYGFSQTTVGIMRSQDKTISAILTRDFLWRLLCIFFVGVLWFFGCESLVLVFLVFSLSLVPVVIYHLRASGFTSFNGRLPYQEIDYKQITSISFGFTLIAFISSADSYLFTFISGYYLDATSAGAFFSSIKIVELLSIFLMAVSLVMATKFSVSIADRNYDMLQRQCNVSLVLQGVPATFSSIIVFLFPEFFLSFFSSDYENYSGLLRLLAFGMLVNSLTGPTGILMQLFGLQWLHVALQGSSILIAIISLPLLKSSFGYISVALAFVLSKTLWNIVAVVVLKRKFGVDPSIFSLITINRSVHKTVLLDLKGFKR